MANEEQNAPEIKEATDELGAPTSEEKRDDDWSPDELSAEDRARYDAAVKAVDDFVEQFPRYRQTDRNRELILEYLADHSLEISPAALALAYEQLQDRLDLEPESEDAEPPESEDEEPKEADRIRQASTAQLARGTRSEQEPPETVEKEPAEEGPVGRRGQPVAWRNGRRLGVGG